MTPTSATGISEIPERLGECRPHGRAAPGFTLLELLVVLVIVGIMMGAVVFNGMPDAQGDLRNDAQRIALLMQLARDEAIVRNRPIAFESDGSDYRFLVREEGAWRILEDDLLRARRFKRAPLALSLTPPLPSEAGRLRVVFGREPVDRPFVLTLAAASHSVNVRADGVGRFTVE